MLVSSTACYCESCDSCMSQPLCKRLGTQIYSSSWVTSQSACCGVFKSGRVETRDSRLHIGSPLQISRPEFGLHFDGLNSKPRWPIRCPARVPGHGATEPLYLLLGATMLRIMFVLVLCYNKHSRENSFIIERVIYQPSTGSKVKAMSPLLIRDSRTMQVWDDEQ